MREPAPRTCRRSCRTVLVALVVSAGPAIGAEPRYAVVDIAALTPSQATVVRGPNSQGHASAAGRELGDAAGGHHGLLFESGITSRPAPRPGGADASTVFSINDDGAYVGSANTATAVRAFAGSAGGGVRELPPLPGDNASVAYGINSLGEAVGFSSGAGGQRAVVWDARGSVRELPAVAGAISSRASDISNRGDVAGLVNAPTARPVLWPRGQPARTLQLIPGDSMGEAMTVNGRGEAIGYTGHASGAVRHAALWAPGGEVTSLGTLPGGAFSEAFGANDAGAVVGSSASSAGPHAFLWTRTGGMQDLNALVAPSRVVLTRATGINNAGDIVVVGYDAAADAAPGEHGHAAQPRREQHGHGPVRIFLLRPVRP
jgi:probable HAF family extracellular repeat protein